MKYVQRRFYLPEDMYLQLSWKAKAENKPIGHVLRDIVAKSLNKQQKSQSAEKLLAAVKKIQTQGPADLASRHTDYFSQAYS